MRKPTRVEWLYLDFDSYFASVEQLLDPRLRGRPVAVLPLISEHTCAIAASREAKTYGIKTGTPVKEARKLCPHIIFRAARHDVYVKLHKRTLEVIDTVVPIAAVRSIDEVACELLASESAQGRMLAVNIKQALARDIGPTLTCSIGLAPTELLAKIAAEMQKPDGLVIIEPQDLPHALYGLKLTDVPGIGRGNSTRLYSCGITDMQSLLRLPLHHARKIWGGVEGARMVAALNGYVVERTPTQKRMFGHSRILPWDWREGDKVLAIARLLTVKAVRRMRRENYAATIFSLSLRGEDRPDALPLRWYGEDKVLPAIDDHAFLGSLSKLFEAAQRRYGAKYRVKKVSIVLHGLVHENNIQPDLFAPSPAMAES
jgi:DNA polymerase IV